MKHPTHRPLRTSTRLGCMALSGVLVWTQVACTQLRVSTAPPPQAELVQTDDVGAVELTEAGPSPRPAGLEPVAGVQFQAFRYAADANTQRLFQGEVLTQLWLEREGRWELVHRDRATQWNRADLVPGKYLLEVVELYEQQRPSQPNEDKVISFEVQPNQSAVVKLVVKKVPWGRVAIVAFSVVIVIGLVVTLVLLRDNLPEIKGRPGRIVTGSRSDYALPPPPRAPSRAGGSPSGAGLLNNLVFVPPRLQLSGQLWWDVTDVMLDTGYALDPWTPTYVAPPSVPRLHAVTPPAAEDMSPRWVLHFDRPMNGPSLSPGTLVLVDEQDRVLACGVYLEDAQTVVVHPLRPLGEGAHRLVVRGPWIFDAEGTALQQTFQLPLAPAAAPALPTEPTEPAPPALLTEPEAFPSAN